MAAHGDSPSHSSGIKRFGAGRHAALLALSAASLLTGCASGDTTDLNGDETGEAADLAAWKKDVLPARTLDKCAYPEGNVGVNAGDTVRDQLTWKGFVDGANSSSSVNFSNFLDCSGVKGLNALIVVQSATWCGYCQQEAEDISRHMADAEDWPAKGIQPVTLMIEDLDSSPAKESTALNWRDQFKLDNSIVAADPQRSFVDPTATEFGLPIIVIIDPRTMKIIDSQQGYSNDDHSKLLSLAEKNAR